MNVFQYNLKQDSELVVFQYCQRWIVYSSWNMLILQAYNGLKAHILELLRCHVLDV